MRRTLGMAVIAAWAVALTPTVLAQEPATPSVAAPLTADDVVASVERAWPVLAQARQGVEEARGALLATQGAFDLKAKSTVSRMDGYYDNTRTYSVLEQPLSTLGIDLYAGYRSGQGTFAPYDGKAQTLSGGEWLTGLRVPLLQDRAIDARRADRQAASLDMTRAEQDLEKSRLSAYKQALAAYWDWVAAGRQYQVARDLLLLAEARDQQLADAAQLGQLAPVERTDNLRAILQRRSALVAAERLVQLRAIDLSLFLRRSDGSPIRPSTEQLPPLPASGDRVPGSEHILIDVARQRRPELLSVQAKREQQEVALRLAQNQRLASLDLFGETWQGTGDGSISRQGQNAQFGVTFALPLQRRKAIGKARQIEAKLTTLQLEWQWVADQIGADVQDALSAVEAARAGLTLLQQEVAVAVELEGLERDRFQLGDSTQFLVNLRELATADARLREARARADYQKALVSLDAATGQLLDRRPSTP
jgi:cobalt-zinc-cadmium efflux system outer membrane protein